MSHAKKIIALSLVAFLIVINLLLPRDQAKAIPVEEVFSIPETTIAYKNWLEKSLDYVLNKAGVILFQNVVRKVINDFAFDAATYVAAGGKGQKALYVTEKWGNFWENVGDAATGEFIESFVNSVISDKAARDVREEKGALCGRKLQECIDRVSASGNNELDYVSCREANLQCLNRAGEVEVGASLCKNAYSECQTLCDNSMGDYYGPPDPKCYTTCRSTYEACFLQAGGSVEQQRQSPMREGNESPLASVNICNPRLDIQLKITLGLTAQQYNSGLKPTCKASEMWKNWTDEAQRIADMMDEDFLANLSTMFDPGGTDLSAALILQSNAYQYRGKQLDESVKYTIANKGWTDVRNWDSSLAGTPGEAETRKKLVDEALWANIGKVTGDIFLDAANVFMSQLALSIWQNLTSNLSGVGQGGSLSFWSTRTVDRQAINNTLAKITEPVFSEGGKINILSDLSACPYPDKPGVKNCVFTSQFADAVTNKMTVLEAVKSGRLNADWPFGFDKNGEDKIPYNQGYPYRSLLILRKYRILPVGWEVAAQQIQNKYLTADFASRPNGVTLGDMLACFSPNDNLTGFNDKGEEAWCQNLVDPNWVLKVPEYYCARQGYGPELMKDPDLIRTGVKYCSADKGQTKLAVDGRANPCVAPDDCCTDQEIARRKTLMEQGKDKELRNFSCAATCSYEETRLSVYRNDKYCGDEQGCIKEGKNGTCLFYGYCTEERRSWVFNKNNRDESCSPTFNTCQSFKGPEGKVSYLANTLDYGCTEQGVGCRRYAYDGAYDVNLDKLAWGSDKTIYFNRQAKTCKNDQEGCHEFVRVKDGAGINLLPDSGFEAFDQDRWFAYGAVTSKEDDAKNQAYAGGYSLHISPGKTGLYYGAKDKSLLPEGFKFEQNNLYTLSAFVYVLSGEVEMVMGEEANPTAQEKVGAGVASTPGWQELVLTVFNDQETNVDHWAIRGVNANADFYLDNVKFEIGAHSGYSAYAAGAALAYQKLLPTYLERVCYKNPPFDYNFREDAPAKCQQFVRRCTADEVGCQLYTEVLTQDATAAQVKSGDYCPKECVGYDVFIQQANNFYSARDEYFIPKTAKTCRAQAVGCSKFVNLDKVKEGGEENEYFAKFRRCVKPDDSCAEFYTWEGDDQSGYQLVVYQLKGNNEAGISQPYTLDDDNATDTSDGEACNDTIYGLPHDHPDYDPDCRQFYGRDGNVSYHLMSKTIGCTDACFPYRLVDKNIDVTITSSTECDKVKGHWWEDAQECEVCLNGGEWQAEHQACVFMAEPDKSQTCSSGEAGCSEYKGNFGNGVKIIFNDTFEKDAGGWGETVELSSDALTVGGHSLQVSQGGKSWLVKDIKGKIKAGKRYVLSFTAKKKSGNVKLRIQFDNQSGQGSQDLWFTKQGEDLNITGEWQNYKLDIQSVKQADLAYAERLFIGITGSANALRIDNLKLVEMVDTHYLIRNSWVTPASCNQDSAGQAAPLYMLGCKEYKDKDGKTHYLKSFDRLCQESAVGCELMINTHNSSFYGAEEFVGGVKVAADNFDYVVYEKKKSCAAANKGCSRFGLYNEMDETHSDAYILNNPDRYKEILCTADQLGCESWTTDGGGQVYFKTPGLRACEYRRDQAGNYGWYKIKNKQCVSATECADKNASCGLGRYCAMIRKDDAGNVIGGVCVSRAVCKENIDCVERGGTCQNVELDEACEVSPDKTVGLGVVKEKEQPVGMAEFGNLGSGTKTSGNAGLCPTDQNTCTEYIDPDSRASFNLVTKDNKAVLKPNVLYILRAKADQAGKITCIGRLLSRINKNNQIESVGDSLTTEVYIDKSNVPTDGHGLSEEFYVSGADETTCTVDSGVAEVKEAIVNYRLKKSLNSERPTTVNFELGQVLFNERSFSGGKYNTLVHNSNLSDGQEPQSAKPLRDNSNALLQVDPNRECAKWLGCRSYVENPNKEGDKICYERGICEQMNEAGECISFVDVGTPQNQTFNTKLNQIGGLTGYSKVGYIGNIFKADLYNLAAMKQEGENKVKFDGSFEQVAITDFVDAKNPAQKVSVVNDARVIEKELGFASYKLIPDGRAVSKTNATNCVTKTVSGASGRYYIISAYVFLRYGTQASLTVGDVKDATCPLESVNDKSGSFCASGTSYGAIAKTNTVGRWVRLSGKFGVANSYRSSGVSERTNQLKIGLCSDGLIYFDDLRLEPGLKIRDDQYIHSDCRLYPESSSMSCDYYDEGGLRKKGWAGYCLEYDPKNPGACLLWYPLDKVEAEEYEEGAALNIAKDLYYCLDAEDQCSDINKVEPEFYCKTFVKVDKTKYWYDRITPGSNYFIPYNLLDPAATDEKYFYADLGINAGGRTNDITLNQGAGSGYFGALPSDVSLKDTTQKMVAGNSNKRLMPFVPYSGWSRAGAGDTSAFCRATLDRNGNDLPYIMELGDGELEINKNDQYDVTTPNVYDNCFVRGMEGGDFNADSCSIEDNRRNNIEKNDVCCDWDYVNGRCRVKGFNAPLAFCDKWPADFKCNTFHCLSDQTDDDTCMKSNQPQPGLSYDGDGTADTKCRVEGDYKNGGKFKLRTADLANDGSESICLFDCVNHTKFYRVAKRTAQNDTGSVQIALRAVKRLFTASDSNESCFTWNATTGKYETDKCPFNVSFSTPTDICKKARKDIIYDPANPDLDYCYVPPVVSDVKLNDSLYNQTNNRYELKGKGWVTLRFNSKVDSQQLPLKKYVIEWGYKDVKTIANVNMFERPSPANPHKISFFLDKAEVCPNLSDCTITPRVFITDNWGNESSSIGSQLDHSIFLSDK